MSVSEKMDRRVLMSEVRPFFEEWFGDLSSSPDPTGVWTGLGQTGGMAAEPILKDRGRDVDGRRPLGSRGKGEQDAQSV